MPSPTNSQASSGARFALLPRQQDVRATEIDKVDLLASFRPGDLIRAQVLSLGDSRAYFLSTAKNDLGVILAKGVAVPCTAQHPLRVVVRYRAVLYTALRPLCAVRVQHCTVRCLHPLYASVQLPSRASKDNHKYISRNGALVEADDETDTATPDRRQTGPRSNQARRRLSAGSGPGTPGAGGKGSAPQAAAKSAQPSPAEAAPGDTPEGDGERGPRAAATVAANVMQPSLLMKRVMLLVSHCLQLVPSYTRDFMSLIVLLFRFPSPTGKAGDSPMELAMTRARGKAYATEAVRFREEGRQQLEVNDELQLKLADQEKQVEELKAELQSRDSDLKDALALLKHLAQKLAEDQLGKLNWRAHIKEACDDFLFKQESLNLSPDPEQMLAALIMLLGIPWHVDKEGKPFSSPAFVKCARLWDSSGDMPVALFPVQLLVILAAVRYKFRHPSATRSQLDRSGDPGALARQARVVQRWINSSDVTRKDGCLGIGKLCIVGWKEIPEDELAADEYGDEGLDLTSNIDSQEQDYDEDEEQPELF
ncbi:unnamed protein product [Closterium sp. Yama58-4]|nr:unnamed protein product [Closterium sp. Yama58-4]